MKEIIRNNIQGKKVLILFILTNLVYASMLLLTIPKVMNFSGGMNILDMLPTGYDYEYVNSLFLALGKEGRAAYLYNQIPVDMLYPFLFGIGNCLLLAYLFNKIQKLNGPLIYLCLIPLFGSFFDYLENIGVIALLLHYPDFSNFSVTLTNYFTIIKSVLTTVFFMVLIATFIAFGIKRLKKGK